MIAGVDEVGRGPWAGPVVAAAVVLRTPITGLADSKRLSIKKRNQLALIVREQADYAIGAASVTEIERLNILAASMLAMRRAVLRLRVTPSKVLVDGNRVPELPYPALAIVGGDGSVPEISAASIIAKVLRDELMARLDRRYPGYGWATNAGYGTAQHQGSMRHLGLTPQHRRGFKPVAAMVGRETL